MAFQDGKDAGFAAALAQLRNPSNEIECAAIDAYRLYRSNLVTAVCAALAAAADAMGENGPQTANRPES